MWNRESYAGLKILPTGAYEKFQVQNEVTGRVQTHFRCLFLDTDTGKLCGRSYPKSTSLIVHYQRHIDLKPFRCRICDTYYTQSGTLVRHNRAIHNIEGYKTQPGN